MTRPFDTIVVLDHPKHAVNVGGVMRSAVAFGIDAVILVGRRYDREPSDVFDSLKHLDVLPVRSWDRALELLCGIPLVTVERIAGTPPLNTFRHPRRAAYIFGPEDDSVHRQVIDVSTHRVHIPHATSGNPHWGCLNLATSVAVVLYDRLCRLESRADRRYARL
jgi:tRNA G18 (ribose-2'-O)-methylase SpoU